MAPWQAGTALWGARSRSPPPPPSAGPGQVALQRPSCPARRRPEELERVPGQRGRATPHRDTEIGEKPRPPVPGTAPGLRGGGSASSPGLGAPSRGSAEHEGAALVPPGAVEGASFPLEKVARPVPGILEPS